MTQSTTTVRDRLLDATIEVAADHGLARLSVGDVAKRAGLSRQTLYKHFPSKDELVSQAVLREAGRMVEVVIAAADAEEDPQRSLEVAILTTLQVTRDHPLLDRLVRTEPETLLPLLVSSTGPVADAVREVVVQIVNRKAPDADAADARRAADVVSRLLISYAVNPPTEPPAELARFLSTFLAAELPAADSASARADGGDVPPR